MLRISSSLVTWDPVLRYKRFWSKFLCGARQGNNLNLIALNPKRSAVNWSNFIPRDWKRSVCKFCVIKRYGYNWSRKFSGLSILASFFFTWWSLSAGCQACSPWFHWGQKHELLFSGALHLSCFFFSWHIKSLKGAVPSQAWAEQSSGMKNFWHPLGWRQHAVTAFVLVIPGREMWGPYLHNCSLLLCLGDVSFWAPGKHSHITPSVLHGPEWPKYNFSSFLKSVLPLRYVCEINGVFQYNLFRRQKGTPCVQSALL